MKTSSAPTAHAVHKSTDEWTPPALALPPLPTIDWSKMDAHAPKLLETPDGSLPAADVIVVTWAEAEWAAMQHVFVSSGTSMPYSDAGRSEWAGWQDYDWEMPKKSGWDEWGYYRLVQVGRQRVLLFKSNTHLDYPGESFLTRMTEQLIEAVRPKLLLSIGTAGGSRRGDRIGTVNAVNAGTLDTGGAAGEWPTYTSSFKPPWGIVGSAGFSSQLMRIPVTAQDLATRRDQFNAHYQVSYTLDQLDALGLDTPNTTPHVNDLVKEGTSLLTTSSFLVGNTGGNFAKYAVVEMDDAILGMVASQHRVQFGFIRNVSDPAQNAALPVEDQRNWGSLLYDTYGFHTSYNGALATAAVLLGM